MQTDETLPIVLRPERMFACEAQADRALRAVLTAAAQGDDALGTAGTAMPLVGKSGNHYLAHALPLTSGHGGSPVSPMAPRRHCSCGAPSSWCRRGPS